MSGSSKDQAANSSRRSFLKAAGVTAAVAATAGTGAVLVAEKISAENQATTIKAIEANNPVANAVAPSAPAAQSVAVDNSEVFKQLAAAQAENVRLQTALDNANSRIAALEGSVNTGTSESESLRAELAAAGEKLGVLGGLVALYEKLDTPDLSEVVSNGLTEVGASVNELMDDIPTVSESLQAGRAILDNFESEVPLVDSGRLWLLAHVTRIRNYYEAVESVLETAVDATGPFLEMLTNWFQKVMAWLPFGLGEATANLMDAMVTLMGEMPATISGTLTNVMQPLEIWLGDAESPEFPVLTKVVEPVRNEVIAKTEGALSKASGMHDKYNAKLARPATDALARHDAIRQSIADYRRDNQI